MENIKPLEKMTTKELKDWIEWAKSEIDEYECFIMDLEDELLKRK